MADAPTVTVLLVTEHPGTPPFVSELAGNHYFRPVGRVTSVAAALEGVRERTPDVVVVEVQTKERLDALLAVGPDMADTPIVVVSALPEEVALLTCLAAGLRGFVRKPVEPGLLGHAMSAAARGLVYVDPRCTAWLVAMAVHGFKARPQSGLTLRQEQVLQLVRGGLTNREIARALAISPETVKIHLRRAMRRLGAHTRWDATARANPQERQQ